MIVNMDENFLETHHAQNNKYLPVIKYKSAFFKV